MRKRKPNQENAVHEAEDGGVRADAESEREDRHRGEAGIFAEHARAVAKVLPQIFCEADATGLAAFFFGAFDRAEFEASAAERFFSGDACANQILRVSVEVKLNFRVNLALHVRAMQRGVQPGTKTACERHTSSGFAPRIPAITSAMRFHFSASVCRRRLPAAVRR